MPASGAIVLPLSGFSSTTMSDIKQIQIQLSGLAAGQLAQVLNSEAVPVPEPGTAFLTAAGLVWLATRRRRRR